MSYKGSPDKTIETVKKISTCHEFGGRDEQVEQKGFKWKKIDMCVCVCVCVCV